MANKNTKSNDIGIPAAAAPAPVRRNPAITPRPKHVLPRSSAAAASDVEAAATGVAFAEKTHTPTDSEIAALAYTYWAERGCQGGSPEEDWLRAERELRAKVSA